MSMNVNHTADELLTVRQVGEVLKLTRQAITTMRAKGKLPVVKLGRSVRVRRSVIDKLIQDGVQ